MKTRILVFIGLSCLVFNSCFDWKDCIDGNGDITSESRDVNGFSRLEVDGSFDVFITQGNNTSVMIEADENLMDYILTKTNDGKLEISTRRDRCFNTSHQVSVYVTTPDLTDIRLFGSGNVECEHLATSDIYLEVGGSGSIYLDYVTADHADANVEGSGYIECFADAATADLKVEGSGEIRMSGIADEADMLITGSGLIRANEFDVDDCFATITGSGDIYTLVSSFLDAKITGSGTIYYYGDPEEVREKITGSGDVIKRN